MPFLKEVYKKYASHFVLWSHRSLTYDADLSGAPDYMLATPSALGRIVFGRPVVLLIEAKRNDFVEGWGQCAAAMVVAQKLNSDPAFALYGIVTDGEVWRFGKLVVDTFVDHPTFYTINNVGELLGALNGILATVQRQIAEIWRPARV